jgi:hypothetical protein
MSVLIELRISKEGLRRTSQEGSSYQLCEK